MIVETEGTSIEEIVEMGGVLLGTKAKGAKDRKRQKEESFHRNNLCAKIHIFWEHNTIDIIKRLRKVIGDDDREFMLRCLTLLDIGTMSRLFVGEREKCHILRNQTDSANTVTEKSNRTMTKRKEQSVNPYRHGAANSRPYSGKPIHIDGDKGRPDRNYFEEEA